MSIFDKNFDYLFYLNFYPDLRKSGIINKTQAIKHYFKYGINEGRIGHPKEIKKNMEEGINQIYLEYSQYISKNKAEEKINILIRTSNRPKYFQKCIQSIIEQQYENYNVIICYDKEESLIYLNQFDNDYRITYFPLYVESKEKYRFNLYCNILMDKVEEGWIIFLDDDDMLCHDKALSIINEHLTDKNSLYIWKFLRPDKIIFPKNVNIVRLGEIVSCGFIFNNVHKYNSRWPDKQFGDYAFFSGLHSYLPLYSIDSIITRTVNDRIIGNFGN